MFCSDSGRGSSLLDRTIADRRQLNTITLPDFSDPETGENKEPEGMDVGPGPKQHGVETARVGLGEFSGQSVKLSIEVLFSLVTFSSGCSRQGQ